jgi:NADH dehydrogenase FAD-containing subunit
MDASGCGRARVVVLGGSFAGLTAARLIRQHARDSVELVAIDRNPLPYVRAQHPDGGAR